MNEVYDFETALDALAWHGGTQMTAKGKAKLKQNKVKNMFVEKMVLRQNLDMALRRYRVKGLEDTMSERVVLNSLLYFGSVLFFRENGHNYAQACNPLGGFTMNEDYTAAFIKSKNGIINKEVGLFVKGGDNSKLVEKTPIGTIAKDKSGVILWENNNNRMPFIDTVLYYTSAIADTLRTIDTARLWIKRPFIPVCEESLVSDVIDMTDAIRENDDLYIASTGIMDINKFNVLQIDGSGNGINAAKELVEWYKQQYREACNMKSNTQSDKKGENLLSDEINFNLDFTNAAEDDIIKGMNEQLEFVNEVMGTNIKVEAAEPQEEKPSEKEENLNDEADI